MTAGAISSTIAVAAFSALLMASCCNCSSNACILGILCSVRRLFRRFRQSGLLFAEGTTCQTDRECRRCCLLCSLVLVWDDRKRLVRHFAHFARDSDPALRRVSDSVSSLATAAQVHLRYRESSMLQLSIATKHGSILSFGRY